MDTMIAVMIEGSAHLADTISGRAMALNALHTSLKNKGSTPFLNVGQFSKSHKEVAEIIADAPDFSEKANSILYNVVSSKINSLQKINSGNLGDAYMGDMTDIVAKHVSRIAADEAMALNASHMSLKNKGSTHFLDVGQSSKNHKEVAEIIADAPDFSEKANPISNVVSSKTNTLPKINSGDLGEALMRDKTDIEAKHVSRIAADKAGMTNNDLTACSKCSCVYDTDYCDWFETQPCPLTKDGFLLESILDLKKDTSASKRDGSGWPGGQDRIESSPHQVGAGSPGQEGVPGSTGQQAETGTPGQQVALEGAGEQGGAGTPGQQVAPEGAGEQGGTGTPGQQVALEGAGGQGGTGTPGQQVAPEGGGQQPSAGGLEVQERLASEQARPVSAKSAGARLEGKPLPTQKAQDEEGALNAPEIIVSDEEIQNANALSLLIKKLNSEGENILYEQPPTTLTHKMAADRLQTSEPAPMDQSVRQSCDLTKLTKKLERKLTILMSAPGSFPQAIKESMQDVIIESSRILSEYFIDMNYKTYVRDALISEMQKKGNEILIEVDGAAETYFFAAQRLKKAKSYEVKEPCTKLSYYISKKLDEMIRCRPMPRKLTGVLKEFIKKASDFLSTQVTKPDVWIEAYVSILDELDNTGAKLLFREDVPKSYKDCATYLRCLPSYEDRVKKFDLVLNAAIPLKLVSMMRYANKKGDSAECNAITVVSKLLVSYIKQQKELTEVLKCLVTLLDGAKCGVILNHGKLRKTYMDAADLLRDKNTDQINRISQSINPVAARKVQVKLENLFKDVCVPSAFKEHLEATIEVATNYLAMKFLEPHTTKVCKCMNNVFVQCELWCDEILRKISRPICSCSRHAASQMIKRYGQGISMEQRFRAASPLTPNPCPLTFKECPSTKCSQGYDKVNPCPASLKTTTYLMYSASYDYLSRLGTVDPLPEVRKNDLTTNGSKSSLTLEESVVVERLVDNTSLCDSLEVGQRTPRSCFSTPKIQTSESSFYSAKSNFGTSSITPMQSVDATSASTSGVLSGLVCPTTASLESSVVSTDQMADWHALMVSFVWNIQTWRDWLQEIMDHGLHFHATPAAKLGEHWLAFRNRVRTETAQWRHYNAFSRELLVRIALRYHDKIIISPTRATERTREFLSCQDELLDIIEMFNQWTKWMAKTVNETDALEIWPGDNELMSDKRLTYFKEKMESCSDEWLKYSKYLKTCWQGKLWTSIAEWLPHRQQSGPLWVVSACGAVPSGAVVAGLHDGLVCFVARTTHRHKVLPASLVPAKHCCWLYADGKIHYYTKYQVMCNADVSWVPWRAGTMRSAAIRVAPNVYIGRVLYRGNHLVGAVQAPTYRCHVVIFSRPFAFSCYELLVLAPASTGKSSRDK